MKITQFDVMHFYRDLNISARWRDDKKTTIIKTSLISNRAIFGEWEDENGEHDFEWYDDSKDDSKKGWHDIKPILRHICSMSDSEHEEWLLYLHCKNGQYFDTRLSTFWLIKNGFDAFDLIERGMAIDRDGAFENMRDAIVIETVKPSRIFKKPDRFVNECPHYWWMFRRDNRVIL